MKECYVKCQSSKQAQTLIPYLVNEGFVDDAEWNDVNYFPGLNRDSINIEIDRLMHLHEEDVASDYNTPLLYAVPADADLAEVAKTIKTLFDKL